MTTDPFRELDGAYVLGALTSDERRAYEEHLSGCTECAAAVRDLAGLPGLLATVPRSVAEGDPAQAAEGDPAQAAAGALEPPPDTLLPALVRQVRRETRRWRWRTGLVAASAVAALAVGGIVWEAQRDDAPATPVTAATATTAPTPAPTATRTDTPMAAVVTSPVRASVALTGVAWGTRLELTCTYAEADDYAGPGPAAYVLVVRGKDGRTEQVASWRALPGRTMRLSGASAYSVDEIAAVELRTQAGSALLELRT